MTDAKGRPLLAITMGDPAGSGPEIVTKSLAEPEIRGVCRPVVIGDASTMREALALTKMPGEVRAIRDVSEASFDPRLIEVVDLENVDLGRLERGRVSARCGQASYEYIKLATELALAGTADAIVTSAISKEA